MELSETDRAKHRPKNYAEKSTNMTPPLSPASRLLDGTHVANDHYSQLFEATLVAAALFVVNDRLFQDLRS